jgi:hypothetical protein
VLYTIQTVLRLFQTILYIIEAAIKAFDLSAQRLRKNTELVYRTRKLLQGER